MADFHYTIDGKPRQIRRLTLDELVVLGDLAYEEARTALLRDKTLIHNIDAALADLRERSAGTSLLWRYVASLAGSRKVMEQIDLTDCIDSLTREDMLEIVGRACGFTVMVKRDSEQLEDETNPTRNGTGPSRSAS